MSTEIYLSWHSEQSSIIYNLEACRCVPLGISFYQYLRRLPGLLWGRARDSWGCVVWLILLQNSFRQHLFIHSLSHSETDMGRYKLMLYLRGINRKAVS